VVVPGILARSAGPVNVGAEGNVHLLGVGDGAGGGGGSQAFPQHTYLVVPSVLVPLGSQVKPEAQSVLVLHALSHPPDPPDPPGVGVAPGTGVDVGVGVVKEQPIVDSPS